MTDADGSVIVKTELDDEEAQAKLNRLEKKIDRLNEKASEAKQAKLPLEQQALDLGAALDTAKQKLDALKSGGAAPDVISDQAETVKSLQYQWNQVNNQVDRYNRTITNSERKIEIAKEDAADYTARLMAADYTPAYSEETAAALERMEGAAKSLAETTQDTAQSSGEAATNVGRMGDSAEKSANSAKKMKAATEKAARLFSKTRGI